MRFAVVPLNIIGFMTLCHFSHLYIKMYELEFFCVIPCFLLPQLDSRTLVCDLPYPDSIRKDSVWCDRRLLLD